MVDDVIKIRDSILVVLLPDVPFEGWSWKAVLRAAQEAGYDEDMALAVFPEGISDVLAHFSGWLDRQMLEKLQGIEVELLRVRDRIGTAVMARFLILQEYREAGRLAFSSAVSPMKGASALKALWRTADLIWVWAGDTAQDYNHYTKRSLLGGVMASTALAWAGDESDDLSVTRAFLERRIKNVMQLGRFLGKIRNLGMSSEKI